MVATSGPASRSTALLVVDPQQGFDEPSWGRRNNLDADANIAALMHAAEAAGWYVVLTRHDSTEPDSTLRPDRDGNRFKAYAAQATPDLLVVKSVNSCFHGTPDLHGWLQEHGVSRLVVCGITTNHCCETTSRLAGNLGYDVEFVLDATHTFDRTGPDGRLWTAEELAAVTATNLHGEFATVTSTAQVLSTRADVRAPSRSH
jgi:nicotinamidase-related amidase